jgi:hypothetical protein
MADTDDGKQASQALGESGGADSAGVRRPWGRGELRAAPPPGSLDDALGKLRAAAEAHDDD